MKAKPLLTIASLALLAGGCASDPSFNLLPPEIYQRGSIQPSAHPGIGVAGYHVNYGGLAPSPVSNTPVRQPQTTAL